MLRPELQTQQTPASNVPFQMFGSQPKETYFHFEFACFPILDFADFEMSDIELLMATEKAGSFAFLDNPKEDVYNDLLGKTE